MLIHNLGDWIRKVRERLRGAVVLASPMELRMLPAERWQHGLLVLSFVTLAWTGFALKFPDRFWAYPLVIAESSWPVRGWVHRISAVVFVITAVAHLITLVVNPRLREHWKHLLPAWLDLRQAWEGFRFNIGLRKDKPEISGHSYVEKAEYWAVVWGAVLMSLSGIVLWANNFFLSHAPKALMDIAAVVHYYEAVLAVLAILVWHFYFVIFDPEVYPMSMAWLTGYGPSKASPESASRAATPPAPTEASAGEWVSGPLADESRDE
jgi:formate dehydrogenase gamma subunit